MKQRTYIITLFHVCLLYLGTKLVADLELHRKCKLFRYLL